VIGASNFDAHRLDQAMSVSAAHGLNRYESLQPHYNLYDRTGFEAALQDLCVAHEIGVICYASLAGGFLTGKYRIEADLAQSVRGGGVRRYLDERGKRILAALDAVAADQAATPAQIALAWLMAQPGITAPIASATSVAQLEDLTASARLILTADQLQFLDKASRPTIDPLV
jgi:aryl-alcohol dehydrogenase-like predicted oxidoreductase